MSIVVPFHGDDRDATEMLAAVNCIERREDDELIIADNTEAQVVARHAAGRVTVVDAAAVRSSYSARNVGAEHVRSEWLLFLDADCRPPRTLLDAYFEERPEPRCGAVGGEVVGSEDQQSLVARYARSRRHIGQADIQDHQYKPMAVTANLLVRREAWRDVGGFHEGIRSSGDADFTWRLQDAGWSLGYAAMAAVEHLHRETLRDMARQAARYGAGRRWLRRRHPEATFPRPLPGLARCAAGIVVWTLTLRFERALFKALDAIWLGAGMVGAVFGNRAGDAAVGPPGTVMLVERFPERGETAVADLARALGAAGTPVRIEAVTRATQPELAAGRGLRVTYLEDDGIARQWGDLCRLAARHPVRCARDLRHGRGQRRGLPLRSLAPAARRVAAGGDREVCGGAVDGRRLGQLVGVPHATEDHDPGRMTRSRLAEPIR